MAHTMEEPGSPRPTHAVAHEDTYLLQVRRSDDTRPGLFWGRDTATILKYSTIGFSAFVLANAVSYLAAGGSGGIWLSAAVLPATHDSIITRRDSYHGVSSRLNPDLTCVVLDCVDMLYSGGEDSTIDRPGHLRAASSMQWITDSRLAIVQDDSNFIALVDVKMDEALYIQDAYSISLPASLNGVRQFQTSRGNKKRKLDLEASIYVPKEHSPIEDGFLLAFGSGSSDFRNVIILVRDSLLHSTSDVSVEFQAVNTTYWSAYGDTEIHKPIPSPLMAFYVPSFYEDLASNTDFAGSELNMEGAAFIESSTREPAKIRFFQRGNGAPDIKRGLYPKSSTGEIVARDLFRYMDSLLLLDDQAPLFYPDKASKDSPPPRTSDVVEFNLGSSQGVNLTFTGSSPASLSANRVFEETEFVYIAGAEASPDATRDGAVVGTAMGLVQSIDFRQREDIDYDSAFYNFLSYPNGTQFLHKTEGVTIPPGTGFWKEQDGVALTVLDMDDPNVPSQMCIIRVQIAH